METNSFRCPKCSHEQENKVECEACGLIFFRYELYLNRQKEKEAALEAQRQERKFLGTGMKGVGVAVLLLLAALSYYFVRPVGQEKATAPDAAFKPQPRSVQALKPQALRAVPAQTQVAEAEPAAGKIPEAPVAQEVVIPGSPIEKATNATVSIETPLGTGSGFFVNKSFVVTNRHVVEVDQKDLAEEKKKVEYVRNMIELEKQKQQNLRKQLEAMPDGPGRQQLALFIQTRDEEVNKEIPHLEEAEARIAAMEKGLHPSEIKIFLADGRESRASYLQVSSKHDLAILALYSMDSAFLSRPPETQPLRPGNKVMAIGSPVGLRNTVTSGIFSSYRIINGVKLLQIDAPINPGNSGGPLIDENGYVFGVNTMIFNNTEGIGFAIPIEVVFEEFGAQIQRGYL